MKKFLPIIIAGIVGTLSYWGVTAYLLASALKDFPPIDVGTGEAGHAASDTGSKPVNFNTDELQSLSESLLARDNKLEMKSMELAELEKRIATEREQLEKLRGEVERQQNDLSNFLLVVDQTEMDNVKRLVSVYSEMKPETLLLIFNEMTDSQVALLLAQMSADQLSKIFETMANATTDNKENIKRVIALTEELRRFSVKPD